MNKVLKYTIVLIVFFGIYTSPGLGYLGARISISYIEDSHSYSKQAETVLNHIIKDIFSCQNTSNPVIPLKNTGKNNKKGNLLSVPALFAGNHASGKVLLVISLIFMVFIVKTYTGYRKIPKICNFIEKYLKWLFRFLTPLAKCIKTRIKQTDGDYITGGSWAIASFKSPYCVLYKIIVRVFLFLYTPERGSSILFSSSEISFSDFLLNTSDYILITDNHIFFYPFNMPFFNNLFRFNCNYSLTTSDYRLITNNYGLTCPEVFRRATIHYSLFTNDYSLTTSDYIQVAVS
jgi:hypothetical protein